MERWWRVGSILLVGCGVPAGEKSGPPARRDSAGFEIVENARDVASLPVWKINPTALTNVGGDTSTFARVTGARQLGDGSIMVTDVQAAEVRLFDSTGALIRVLGRKGRGPGEFDSPGPPVRLGADTTYVLDQFIGRLILFFGPDLVPTTVVPRRPSIPLIPIGWVTSDTGVAATIQMDPSKTAGGRYPYPFSFVRFTMQGAIVDTIVVGRGFEAYDVNPGEEAGGPGARYNRVAMGSETKAAVVDRRLYVTETGEPEFKTFDLLRRLTRVVRWAGPRDPVTAGDRRDWIVAESTGIANGPRSEPAARAAALANLRKQLFSEKGPYHTDFLPTDDGGVWLEQYSRPWTLIRRYLVFDSTGTLTARVELPPRIRPFQILGDRMVARWRNEDDVDYIRIYRIEK